MSFQEFLSESLDTPVEFYLTDDTILPDRISAAFKLDDHNYVAVFERSDIESVYKVRFGRVPAKNMKPWNFFKQSHIRPAISTLLKIFETVSVLVGQKMRGIAIEFPNTVPTAKYNKFLERVVKKSFITSIRPVKVAPYEVTDEKIPYKKNYLFLVRKPYSPHVIFNHKEFKKYEFDIQTGVPQEPLAQMKTRRMEKKVVSTVPSAKFKVGEYTPVLEIDDDLLDKMKEIKPRTNAKTKSDIILKKKSYNSDDEMYLNDDNPPKTKEAKIIESNHYAVVYIAFLKELGKFAQFKKDTEKIITDTANDNKHNIDLQTSIYHNYDIYKIHDLVFENLTKYTELDGYSYREFLDKNDNPYYTKLIDKFDFVLFSMNKGTLQNFDSGTLAKIAMFLFWDKIAMSSVDYVISKTEKTMSDEEMNMDIIPVEKVSGKDDIISLNAEHNLMSYIMVNYFENDNWLYSYDHDALDRHIARCIKRLVYDNGFNKKTKIHKIMSKYYTNKLKGHSQYNNEPLDALTGSEFSDFLNAKIFPNYGKTLIDLMKAADTLEKLSPSKIKIMIDGDKKLIADTKTKEEPEGFVPLATVPNGVDIVPYGNFAPDGNERIPDASNKSIKTQEYFGKVLGYSIEYIKEIDDKGALYNYTSNDYQYYNRPMRYFAHEQEEKLMKIMQNDTSYYRRFIEIKDNNRSIYEAIKVFDNIKPLPEGVWTFRSAKMLSDDIPWDMDKMIIDAGIGSVTINADSSYINGVEGSFGGKNSVFAIYLPKGSKVVPMLNHSHFEGEMEVLLPPASVMKPISVYIDPNKYNPTQYIRAIYLGSARQDFIKDFAKAMDDKFNLKYASKNFNQIDEERKVNIMNKLIEQNNKKSEEIEEGQNREDKYTLNSSSKDMEFIAKKIQSGTYKIKN